MALSSALKDSPAPVSTNSRWQETAQLAKKSSWADEASLEYHADKEESACGDASVRVLPPQACRHPPTEPQDAPSCVVDQGPGPSNPCARHCARYRWAVPAVESEASRIGRNGLGFLTGRRFKTQ